MSTVVLGITCNGCDANDFVTFDLSETAAADFAERMAHGQVVAEMITMRERMHQKGWTSRPAEPVYSYLKMTWDGEVTESNEQPFASAFLDYCPKCSGKLLN